jgi:hypothetical protein
MRRTKVQSRCGGLHDGGIIEHEQPIAAHESPRTTKLYDRTNDAISLYEIELILIWRKSFVITVNAAVLCCWGAITL